jgi:exodeoxyribonuclease-5
MNFDELRAANDAISNAVQNTQEQKKPEDFYLLFEGVYANEGQKLALDKLKEFLDNKNKKYFTLIGSAGTGKTTIMKKVREMTTKRICGATISHQARNVLEKSIKETYTIASLLGIKLNEETGKFTKTNNFKNPPAISTMSNSILIIDETSMIDEEILEEIRRGSPSSLKIIFVGDSKQLPPIGQTTGISPTFSISEDFVELKQVMRFGDTISIVANKIAKVIEDDDKLFLKRKTAIEDGEGVMFSRSEVDVLDLAKEDFLKDPFNTRLITYNNHNSYSDQSVKYLNRRMRDILYGQESEEILVGEVFTLYAPFTNEKEETIAQNSETFKILSIEKGVKDVQLSVYSHKEGERTFNAKYDIYKCEVHFQEGRKIKMDINLDPRFREDIEKIAKTKDWQLYFSLQKKFAIVEYGLAVTCHKCQGSGYDNVYVFEDNIMRSPQSYEYKMRTLYTAITRAKKKLVIQGSRN